MTIHKPSQSTAKCNRYVTQRQGLSRQNRRTTSTKLNSPGDSWPCTAKRRRARLQAFCTQSTATHMHGTRTTTVSSGHQLFQGSRLRLFLDCADVRQWEQWSNTALFYGVTTNPAILQRDTVPCTLSSLRQLAIMAQRLKAVDIAADQGYSELQLQTWGTNVPDMVANGLRLADLPGNITVKVPVTKQGTEAASKLIARGVPVTLTGLYNSRQALTAIACGAAYAAPYLGRMNDSGRDGISEITAMQQMVSALNSSCRILVASVRDATDMVMLSSKGCDTFTIAPSTALQLFDEPLTDAAATAFQAAAEAMGAAE